MSETFPPGPPDGRRRESGQEFWARVSAAELAAIPPGTVFRPVPGWRSYDVDPEGRHVCSYHGAATGPDGEVRPARLLHPVNDPDTGQPMVALCESGASVVISPRRLAYLVYHGSQSELATELSPVPPPAEPSRTETGFHAKDLVPAVRRGRGSRSERLPAGGQGS